MQNNTKKIITALLSALQLAVHATHGLESLVDHHRHRFLVEKKALREELALWESSEYGQEARAYGFGEGTQELEGSTIDKENEKLWRFFQTKLSAERIARENPHASFSTDTPFALMTDEEFAQYVAKGFGFQTPDISAWNPEDDEATHLEIELPSTLDWKTSSECVAPVKSQGKCGNCWSFGSTAGAESFYCLKKNGGKLVTFSEQELTSCDPYDNGCDGGRGENALYYISRYGICTDIEYPYTSGTTKVSGECLKNQNHCTPVQTGIKGSRYVQGYSDEALMRKLSQQPVSVTVTAGNPAWKTYTGGIITSCNYTKIDHVVLVIGYGELNGTEYYHIKNSWGTTWGMEGFLMLERNIADDSIGRCSMLNGPFVPY